jgi:hypothetical protein
MSLQSAKFWMNAWFVMGFGQAMLFASLGLVQAIWGPPVMSGHILPGAFCTIGMAICGLYNSTRRLMNLLEKEGTGQGSQ